MEKSLSLNLGFIVLDKNGQMITDGEERFSISQQEITTTTTPFSINLKGNGGFVMKF